MMKFPTEWKVIIHSCSKPPTSLDGKSQQKKTHWETMGKHHIFVPGSRAESTVHGPLPGGEKVRSETSQLFERSFAGFIMYIKWCKMYRSLYVPTIFTKLSQFTNLRLRFSGQIVRHFTKQTWKKQLPVDPSTTSHRIWTHQVSQIHRAIGWPESRCGWWWM